MAQKLAREWGKAILKVYDGNSYDHLLGRISGKSSAKPG